MKKWLTPLCDPQRFFSGLREYFVFIKSWKHYARMPGAEALSLRQAYPCLFDRTQSTPIDAHYFYQSVWAMERIKASGVAAHVDVGSLAVFVGLLSTIAKVVFIDLRPLPIDLPNLEMRRGSLLSLPLADASVPSISCLHVAEHVGLGRYGDALDPQGTKKAALELTRVLAPNGSLYVSLPLGKPRLQFNAHRIHSPSQILEYFSELDLAGFSAVNDKGEFKKNIAPAEMANERYACGMFHFTKKAGVASEKLL